MGDDRKKGDEAVGSDARDRAIDGPGARGPRRRADGGGVWAVDAIPLLIQIDQEGSERPTMIVVASNGIIVDQDLMGRLDGGAPEVAAALAELVRGAAEGAEARPDTVRVRHDDVRAALAPLLAPHGIEVEFQPELPEIEEIALGLMNAIGCPPLWPPVGRSDTWTGWGLPRPLVAELFEAAAGFWEAAPWSSIENMQAPRCVLRSGRAWTAMVLGNGGQEFGLILHSEHADAFERPGLDDPSLAFEGVSGRMLSLIFEPLGDMPKRVRKEIATLRWRVADTRACPDLMTVNTPGGGISEDEARDLILLLRAMPRFSRYAGADLEREIREGRPVDLDWTDAETGVVFRYRGEGVGRGIPVDFQSAIPPDILEELEMTPMDLESVIPPELHEELARALEEMDREVEAAREEGCEDLDHFIIQASQRVLERIGLADPHPLEEIGGLTSMQMSALIAAEWGPTDAKRTGMDSGALRLRHDLTEADLAGVRAHEGIRALLELADERGGLERTQAGNLKVAVVRAWVDRVQDRVPEWSDLADRMGDRFWEEDAPDLHWLRLLADLQGWLVLRKGRFALTREGRRLLEPGREGERYARLFRSCFRDFNLGYASRFDWPVAQIQAAYTLYRLGAVAVDWVTSRELMERRTVAAFAEDEMPSGRFIRPEWVLEDYLLRPVVWFGLLDRRWDEEGRCHLYRVAPRYLRFLEFGL